MKKIVWMLAACAVLVTSSACGSTSSSADGGSSGDLQALLQGTWASPCNGGTGFSEKSVVTFSGLNFTSTLYDFTNGTCTGTGTVFETSTGSFTVVGTVTATLGSATVTAYQVNGTNSATGGQIFYDLAYIDTAAAPDRMYTGDSSGVNDGSSAAKRPTRLDDSFFMLKQ